MINRKRVKRQLPIRGIHYPRPARRVALCYVTVYHTYYIYHRYSNYALTNHESRLHLEQVPTDFPISLGELLPQVQAMICNAAIINAWLASSDRKVDVNGFLSCRNRWNCEWMALVVASYLHNILIAN
jgi:hypothetical protein